MDFSSMFGGGTSAGIQPGGWQDALMTLGAGIGDVYSDGRGNNLARYQQQMQVAAKDAKKKKGAEAFMTSLFGTPGVNPNFSGPSGPGYSGAAAPTDQTPTYSGGMLDGNPMLQRLAPLLSGMEPEDAQSLALPLLLKQFEKKKFSTTPQYDQNGKAFVMDDEGNAQLIPGVMARDKSEIAGNGQAYNPYNIQPGADFSNKGQPFNSATGAANVPVQNYEMQKAVRSAPKTNVNVSADRSFGTQLGENAGKILDASAAAAQGGLKTITTANQLLSAIDTGQVTAGPGATAVQFFRQVAGNDPQKLVETRNTIQGLAQLTLAARAQMKGQGQISDYEGKLLQRATSGDIDSMTIPEIRTIAKVADRGARLAIRTNKGYVDKARIAAPTDGAMVDFYNVDEPAPYAPSKQQGQRSSSGATVSNWPGAR